MKLRTLLIPLLALAALACVVPPDLRAEYDAALGDLQSAQATPDPRDDEVAEARIVELEQAVIERNASPWTGLLPYGMGGAVLSVLKLVGSRRVRRHYGNALKSISKGQVLIALGDVLKAEGVSHSSPASEAAAEQQPAPQPSQA